MDHASDVGGRVKQLLEEYEDRKAEVHYLYRDGLVNVLEVYHYDGTAFIITITKVR